MHRALLIGIACAFCVFQLSEAADLPKNMVINTIRPNSDGTRLYVVTGVQRGEEPPWLFYATNQTETPGGHSIEFSTEHDEVTIDGRRFTYIKGVRQILTRREGKMLVRRVKGGRYSSLDRIRNGLDGLKFSDVDKVLEDVWSNARGAEPSHATEPAGGPVLKSTHKAPAR